MIYYHMGGSHSTATVNNLSKTLTTIATKNALSCQQSSTQTQNVNVVNTGIKLWSSYGISQTSEINATCAMDAKFQAKMQNDIVNAIANAASTQGIALLDAFSSASSDALTNLQSIVETNVTSENIMKNYSTIVQEQNVGSTNLFISLYESMTIKQGSEIFAQATLKTITDADILNTISNHIDNTATTTLVNPLQVFADMLGTTANMAMIIIIVAIVAVIGGAVLILKDPNASQGVTSIIQSAKKR